MATKLYVDEEPPTLSTAALTLALTSLTTNVRESECAPSNVPVSKALPGLSGCTSAEVTVAT